MMSADGKEFKIRFTNREVSAWGGLALLKKMLDSMAFREAAMTSDLPQPDSNRGYPTVQLIEQLLVSIWCGACRFDHTEVTRVERTLASRFAQKSLEAGIEMTEQKISPGPDHRRGIRDPLGAWQEREQAPRAR